jgi:hypothetical protein
VEPPVTDLNSVWLLDNKKSLKKIWSVKKKLTVLENDRNNVWLS